MFEEAVFLGGTDSLHQFLAVKKSFPLDDVVYLSKHIDMGSCPAQNLLRIYVSSLDFVI